MEEEPNFLSKLKPFQFDIFEECLMHESAGISVQMGGGKTRISLILADETTSKDKQILIVAQSKNNISTWCEEIDKVFGETYGYYIYHKDYDKKYLQRRTVRTRFVITTPEVVKKFYAVNKLEDWLLTTEVRNEGMFGQHNVINYSRNPQPIECDDLIFSKMWGTLIVDEFHSVSNIKTLQCRGLLCIPAERKWLLSGTFFADPDESHILAFYTILNTDPRFPTNLGDVKAYIRGKNDGDLKFAGVKEQLVSRDTVPIVIKKTVHEIVVPLRPEEERIYIAMRNIAVELNNAKYEEDADKSKLSSILLAMVSYLRQCITCPMLPVASMALQVCKRGEVDAIPARFFEQIGELNLDEYLDDVNNVISSKIQRALEIASRHKKVIIFSSLRMVIDLVQSMIEDRETYTLDGDMPGPKRDQIIQACNESESFILFLTYKIGSSGMNLQCADTVIILDVDWLKSNVTQAIARVARQGQEQDVNIYVLVSNTGIENAIFKKQINKDEIIDQLQTGIVTAEKDKFSINDIITLLEQEVVSTKAKTLYVK